MRPPPHFAAFAKHNVPKQVQWDAKTHVLQALTPHAFTQAIGYLKYARRADGVVLYRGQDKIFPGMAPSLFRGVHRAGVANRRRGWVNTYVADVNAANGFLENTPDYAHEPLLQHYGLRTSWLDLVDNAWSALWFGCHQAFVTGHRRQYLHYEPAATDHAYVVLLQAGAEQPVDGKPGLYRTADAELVDLRRAAPSNYLRPHAQHAFLIRRRRIEVDSHLDLADWVIGIISVPMRLARSWLGEGVLATTAHFFPSPFYDGGYEKLLKLAPAPPQHLGALVHVGA